MSIRINENKCVGCKRCLDVCPGSLIKTDENGKAYIKYPKDCWGCTSCLKECKTGAIAFFLGADIGGMGSEMTVNESKDTILWKIKKYTGEEQNVTVYWDVEEYLPAGTYHVYIFADGTMIGQQAFSMK